MRQTIFLFFLTLSLICISCGTSSKNNSPSTSSSVENANGMENLQKAEQYLANGQTNLARQEFTIAAKALAKGDTSSLAVQQGLAKANFHIENYQKAQFYYRKVLEKKTNDYEANFGVGYSKFQMEIYKDAVPYLEKCYQQKSQDPQLMYLLARSLQKAESGVNKRTLELYQKSVEQNWADAMLHLGHIYRYNGYSNRAIEKYEHYIAKGKHLDVDTANWLALQKQPAATAVTTKPTPEEEYLLVCPRCGRLGEKGAELCEFDGEILERVQ